MSLRDQLEAVRDKYGKLTPAVVVDAARPIKHPLHSRFEWDDTVAAEKWRQEQAGGLIRSYRITYAESADGPKTVRGYIAVRGGEGSSDSEYMRTEDVMADPFLRKLALSELKRDVSALKSKYAHLEEFAAVLLGAVA